MHKPEQRNLILRMLAEGYTVTSACLKAGVARMTYQRWYKDNNEFRKRVDEARREGNEVLNDLAISAHAKLMRDGNWSAVRYRLENHISPYKERNMNRVQQNEQHLELRRDLEDFLKRNKPISEEEAKGAEKLYQQIRDLWSNAEFAENIITNAKKGMEEEQQEQRLALLKTIQAIEAHLVRKSIRRHNEKSI